MVQNVLVSLNENLFDEMFLQELETRLETDPLLPNGLVDLMDDSSVNPLCTCNNGSTFSETNTCSCNSSSTFSIQRP